MIRQLPTYTLCDIPSLTTANLHIKTFGRLKSLFPCPHSQQLLLSCDNLVSFLSAFDKLTIAQKKHGYFLMLLESINLGSAVFVKVNRWLEPGFYYVIGQTIQMGKFVVVEGVTTKAEGTGMMWNSLLEADRKIRRMVVGREKEKDKEKETENRRDNGDTIVSQPTIPSIKEQATNM